MVYLMMVRGPVLLMPLLVHIIMAMAPMIITIVEWLRQSQLTSIPKLVDIKVDGHFSERSYDRISKWANKILPPGHTLPRDYYSTKKLIKDLGLPVEKIDAYARHKPTRGRDPRRKKSLYAVIKYLPLTPLMQKLYSEKATAKHMTWHATHKTNEGSMCHPSDAKAWKHFDLTYLDFPEGPRNVRLGLCIDDFAPHDQYGGTYSSWPVIITPYNLPPGMCLSSQYVFLTMVIPGPSNLTRLIDVYLESLIEELLQLYTENAFIL
ncbi:UNVERIFIED_CONTAM: hypothetical protein Sindi_2306600 [Sesamum indicum]